MGTLGRAVLCQIQRMSFVHAVFVAYPTMEQRASDRLSHSDVV